MAVATSSSRRPSVCLTRASKTRLIITPAPRKRAGPSASPLTLLLRHPNRLVAQNSRGGVVLCMLPGHQTAMRSISSGATHAPCASHIGPASDPSLEERHLPQHRTQLEPPSSNSNRQRTASVVHSSGWQPALSLHAANSTAKYPKRLGKEAISSDARVRSVQLYLLGDFPAANSLLHLR